jgi:aminopeptidase C
MSEDENNFTVPADPEVRRKIREAVAEASAQMTMIEDRRAVMKDIKTMAKDDLGVPPKTFNRMVKAFHNQQYSEMVHEDVCFQVFYENIIEKTS